MTVSNAVSGQASSKASSKAASQNSQNGASASAMNTKSARVKLQQLQRELNSVFYEREGVIDGLLVAILARQHVLLLGLPGTAKSNLISEICKAFSGASYFQWLLTKFSTPEEIFGAVSIRELQNDRYVRNTQGKLPEAHMGFLDEIFKSNSSILNSLLTLLNEKLFYNNGTPTPCPLITLVGASNELPEDSSLDALFDRFILRYWIEYLGGVNNFKALLMSDHEPEVTVKISLAELSAMQAEVEQVTIDESVVDSLIKIKSKLSDEGIVASDRRWKQIIKVLKAYAYLQGESEVSEEQFEILPAILWTKKDQISTIAKIAKQQGNPISLKASELLNAAKEAVAQLAAKPQSDQTWGGQANLSLSQLNSIKSELEVLVKGANRNRARKGYEAIKEIDGMILSIHKQISEFFNLSSL